MFEYLFGISLSRWLHTRLGFGGTLLLTVILTIVWLAVWGGILGLFQ